MTFTCFCASALSVLAGLALTELKLKGVSRAVGGCKATNWDVRLLSLFIRITAQPLRMKRNSPISFLYNLFPFVTADHTGNEKLLNIDVTTAKRSLKGPQTEDMTVLYLSFNDWRSEEMYVDKRL